jgi:hypothetical protein
MPDSNLDSEQTKSEFAEGTIIPVVNNGLIKEAKEIETAKYVLNEELIYEFENKDMTFILEREPQKIFNKGFHNDTFAYDDPDFNFNIGDTTVTNSNGEGISMREAHSMYERYDLKEPMTGKIIRINQMTYNHAYFPFNSMGAATLNNQKQGEIEMIQDFLDTDRDSAFDKTIESTAKKEEISISFDGYIFSFARFVHSNGGEHIQLEIEQYKKEDAEDRKCLRKSNTLEGFGVLEFQKLKNAIQDTVRRAKPRV